MGKHSFRHAILRSLASTLLLKLTDRMSGIRDTERQSERVKKECGQEKTSDIRDTKSHRACDNWLLRRLVARSKPDMPSPSVSVVCAATAMDTLCAQAVGAGQIKNVGLWVQRGASVSLA